MEKVNLSSEKFKDPWDRTTEFSFFERDGGCDQFSWPQRKYTCSFCKKEFKSAQALGGHMNVHRRDRAKLRQYSPASWDFHNPNPNPNPNTSSFPAARFIPYSTTTCYSSLSGQTSSMQLASPSSTSCCCCKEDQEDEKVPLMQSPPPSLMSNARPPPCGDIRKKMSFGTFLGFGEFKGLSTQEDHDHHFRVLKKREIVDHDHDHELGLLLRDAKEDLDLELRLGYS